MYNIDMFNNLLCISEFATKVVAGCSGLVAAGLIIVGIWYAYNKKVKPTTTTATSKGTRVSSSKYFVAITDKMSEEEIELAIKNERPTYSTTALILAVFGSLIGTVLCAIGIAKCKQKRYKIKCLVGLIVSVVGFIAMIAITVVQMINYQNLANGEIPPNWGALFTMFS